MHRNLALRLSWWLIAWMALASLHSALAATLVLAQGAGGAEMVEVCTSQGVRWVSLQATPDNEAAAQAPAAATDADGTPHCPLCRFIGDAAPDLTRSDLRFAPPLRYRVPPPATRPPPSPAARVVLMSPPRAPPSALF